MNKEHIDYLTSDILLSEDNIWVNPVGGLGDIIMLSTALKKSYDKYGKKFCVARRAQYTELLLNHPAIQCFGYPPNNSYIVCNDYWMRPEFQDPSNKGLSITLKIFGVSDDGNEEETYLPNHNIDENTKLLLETIPWREKNVIIAFSSESPRKMMHPIKWHIIVEKLKAQQCFVIQVGMLNDLNIHGAYSILGTTSPLQLLDVLKNAELVITPDNFIMHAAHLLKKPTISLFGPTEATRYGYSDHICVQADTSKCEMRDKCLGPHVSSNYSMPCPLNEHHCMNSIDENTIVDIAMSILNK